MSVPVSLRMIVRYITKSQMIGYDSRKDTNQVVGLLLTEADTLVKHPFVIVTRFLSFLINQDDQRSTPIKWGHVQSLDSS